MKDLKIIIFALLLIGPSVYGQDQVCYQEDSLAAQQAYILAISKYLQCCQGDSNNKKCQLGLATCYIQTGDYAKAREIYHTLESDSNYYKESISKLALIYETQQNIPKAIKYFLALQKTYPVNPIYLRKLGSLYLQGREQSEAMLYYKKALHINPRDVLAIQGLTEMYINLDDWDKADSLVDTGIQADSMHVGLQLIKARIKYRLKDYASTAQILNQLTRQTELNNYFNKLLGFSWMQVDSFDKAVFHLQKSLLDESDKEYALYYLALAYEKKKEYDKSEWYFQEAIKAGISDNLAQYHRGLARIYSSNNEFIKAIQSYQNSLDFDYNVETYFYQGNLAEQCFKDKTKAIHYYQKYLKSKPTNTEFISIAKQRVKALKESIFMSGSR